MDLDDIKRGLRAEIKKRENEQYATFQCNVRQMCKDVLAKLEEQESEIAELKKKCEAEKSIGATFSENGAELARWVEELRKEIESLKASHYAEMVDAGMRERSLRRTLWIERADRAASWQIHFSLCHNHSIGREFSINGASIACEGMMIMRTARDWAMIWKNVESKCRAKAEDLK